MVVFGKNYCCGGGLPFPFWPGPGGCIFLAASLYFWYWASVNTFLTASSLSFTSLSMASFTFGSGGGGGGGGLSFLNLSAAVKKFVKAFSIAAFCAAVGCTSFCKISLVLFNRSSIVGGLGGGG